MIFDKNSQGRGYPYLIMAEDKMKLNVLLSLPAEEFYAAIGGKRNI